MVQSRLDEATATPSPTSLLTPVEEARERFDRAAARMVDGWDPPAGWEGLSEMELLEAVSKLTKQT